MSILWSLLLACTNNDQGGLSFLSAQYGWAANNVLEFEVVLPNATIVTASETVNSDLWSALRGGGSSFGFVTNFKLKAYRQDHDVRLRQRAHVHD